MSQIFFGQKSPKAVIVSIVLAWFRPLSLKVSQIFKKNPTLESLPQFVLQTCASIHSDPSFLSIFGNKWLTLTILTSLVSVIVTVTNTFLKMPHVHNEQKVPNTPYWKNYLIVGPLMLLVVTPRLILISIFNAYVRHI